MGSEDVEAESEVEKDVEKDGLFGQINDILHMSEPNSRHLRLCVPAPIVNDIIRLVHDTVHPGISKTFESLHSRFYFPHMFKCIKDFVNDCRPCQVSKPSNEKQPGKLHPVEPDFIPYHTVSIDFVTGFLRPPKDTTR